MKKGINSIAIGSFDGIHLAHQALISRADGVVIIERNSGYLTAGYRRSLYIDKPCYFYHLDRLKALTPKLFVARLREDFPQLKEIIIGYDFHFGRDKEGNAELLKELFDGVVTIIDEVTIDSISIHSRTIKEYLIEGNIEMANRLLGRYYSLDGVVTRGQGLGKKELVATINLSTVGYQLPLSGVYATYTTIDGIKRRSVSFIGHRITTDGSFAVETHILGCDIGEVCGRVEIEFVSFIRTNRKFDSLESLKSAIESDLIEARDILEGLISA
jgi:riboflavin kinase/FMN adenylyltransferase